MIDYYLTIVLAPLLAAIAAGLFGKRIGRAGSHWVTIIGVGLSCVLSFYVMYQMLWGGAVAENIYLYTWAVTDGLRMEVGFLVDRLTALMMVVVTFVSLMVHVYTVGYMKDEVRACSPILFPFISFHLISYIISFNTFPK
jgi:NADH-quinone oxidoreductase subunit L